MARFVFFSFSYKYVKNFKANVVRQSWVINNKPETFVDGSIWEKEKSKGPLVIKKLIEEGLKMTSTTAVLIGENTSQRRWVKYEIIKSFEKGNGIVGIHINRIRGKDQVISARGFNPLDRLAFKISEDGKKIQFYELINGRWQVFKDLPEINNKKSNTLFFENSLWLGNEFGKFFRFSDKFKTSCWVNDDGHKNFTTWISEAVKQARR
jgi:hypothetical protein